MRHSRTDFRSFFSRGSIAVLLLAVLISLWGCGRQSSSGESPAAEGSGAAASAQNEAEAPAAAPDPYAAARLRISEVMVKNRAAAADENGSFPDWVELENAGTESLSLSGWSISDGNPEHMQALPDVSLAPGEFLVVFCREFGLSGDEPLALYDPDGGVRDELTVSATEADRSYALQTDGTFSETSWYSPGFANEKAGYDRFCATLGIPSGLSLNEIRVSNPPTTDGSDVLPDWVELKNNSGEAVDLAGYTLTDKLGKPKKWSFPSRILQPGELAVFTCDGDTEASESNTGFSLNAEAEQLYLFDASGTLVDYVSLHDIPRDGSMGRVAGEAGFFYFAEATRGMQNGTGCRRVSDMPVCLTAEGAYDGVSQVSVALQGNGSVYYTLDCTLPSTLSTAYTGPVTLTETGVIRAVSVEDGALPSRPATFSFFLNEGHVLPVLSLVTEEAYTFQEMFRLGEKAPSIPANLALYENGETRFSHECELDIKGWTSLSLNKKSLGVTFKGRYGGNLKNCDLFGNGITEYHSLAIRAGQDYTFSVFRNELLQDLCLEGSENLYTQESKYSILYVNGAYYGVYCLKEDFSDLYYASHAGVSEDSVEGFRAPSEWYSEYNQLVQQFGQTADMTDPENYEKVTSQINMDSLIDWFLFESWCANSDTVGNMRVYRSPENGNLWEYAFYDLDWGLWSWDYNFRLLLADVGNGGPEMPWFLRNLLNNDDFRDRVLTRYAELIGTVFADDYVLAKIDEYEALLEPELPRDRERWFLTMDSWHEWVDSMRDILRSGYADYTIDTLCECLNLTVEERAHYFG